MSKTLKYVIGMVAGLLVIWFSLDIQKLDAFKAENSTEVFNADDYAKSLWENNLPTAIESAVDITKLLEALQNNSKQAFTQYGKKLGISKTWYFLVSGSGTIKAVNAESIEVLLDNGKQIQLATSFIFGNAVRDGSGMVNIDEFINMTDFNNVSIALNKKVRDEIIPKLVAGSEVDNYLNFLGAIEMNEDLPVNNNTRIIPIFVEFEDAE